VDRTRARLLASEARDERPAEPPGATYPQLRRELLVAERAELVRLRDEGQIGEEVLRRVQRALDIEEAGLL
jgi:hypothetical protein